MDFQLQLLVEEKQRGHISSKRVQVDDEVEVEGFTNLKRRGIGLAHASPLFFHDMCLWLGGDT